jgi:hypothetical protein
MPQLRGMTNANTICGRIHVTGRFTAHEQGWTDVVIGSSLQAKADCSKQTSLLSLRNALSQSLARKVHHADKIAPPPQRARVRVRWSVR